MPKCYPRKDLQDSELGIPLNNGDKYLPPSEKGPFEYKWEEESFFVELNGVFNQAESIDFEFPSK